MADGKVLLEVVVEGKNVKVVQREVEGVTDAVNQNTAAQRRNKKATDEASASHAHYDRGLKGASASSSNTTKNFSKMRDAMGGSSGLVGAYATLAANLFAATAAFGALQRAAQVEQLTQGLQALGQASGIAMVSLSKGLQESTGYATSMQDSMRSVALITSSGFDTSYVERLGTVAKNTSIALGRDMQDSLNRLVKGATKLEPELLDELGIMVRLDEATESYAKSVGKSASQLTNYEKRQAFMNAVLEEGERKFGALGDNVDTNPYDKLSASLVELGTTFLSIFNTVLAPLAGYLAENKLILTGFIAVLSKSILSQAIPALSALTQAAAQAAMASTQAISQEVANKASEIDALKSSMTSLGTLGKRGEAIEESVQQASSLQDLAKAQSTVTRSLAARDALEKKVAGSQTAQIEILKAYQEELKEIIRLEAERQALEKGGGTVATTKRKEFLTGGADLLQEFDANPTIKNYIESMKKAWKQGSDFREGMFELDPTELFGSNLNDLKAKITQTFGDGKIGAGLISGINGIGGAFSKAAVFVESFGTVGKLAIKGIVGAIPVIGQLLVWGPMLIDVFKGVWDYFKSDAQKEFQTTLEKVNGSMEELKGNSEEVNKALGGTSSTITTLTQRTEAQSNIVSQISKNYTDLVNSAKAAGDASDIYNGNAEEIIKTLDEQIGANNTLQKSFEKQYGGYKTLTEYAKEKNITEEEAIKIGADFIAAENVKEKSLIAVAKAFKESNNAFANYLNTFTTTTPFTAYVDAIEQSISALSTSKDRTEATRLALENLNEAQLKYLGLSKESAKLENAKKAVESFTGLASEIEKPVSLNTFAETEKINKARKAAGMEEIQQGLNNIALEEARLETLTQIQKLLGLSQDNLDGISEKTRKILDDEAKRAAILENANLLEKERQSALNRENRILQAQGSYKTNQLAVDTATMLNYRAKEDSLIKQLDEQVRILNTQGKTEQEINRAQTKQKELADELAATSYERIRFEANEGVRLAQSESDRTQQALSGEQEILTILQKQLAARNAIFSAQESLLASQVKIANLRAGGTGDVSAAAELSNFMALEKDRKANIEAEKSIKLRLINMEEKLNNAKLAILRATIAEYLAREGTEKITGENRIALEAAAKQLETLNYSEAANLERRAANLNAQKSLSESEATQLELSYKAKKEAAGASQELAQINLDLIKTISDLNDKVINSRKAILDSERTIIENQLKASNYRDQSVGKYELTAQQTLELEIKFGEEKRRLIEQEAATKEKTIKAEYALLKAQLILQQFEMQSTLTNLSTRKGLTTEQRATVIDLQEKLPAVFRDASQVMDIALNASLDEARATAEAASSEITAAQIQAFNTLYGWTTKMQTSWEDVSNAIGQNFINTLQNAKSITQELADAFTNSVNAAVDAFVDAIVEGKNAFKAIGDALRNSLRDSFAEAAKNKLKEGIAGAFTASGMGDMAKSILGPQERIASAAENTVAAVSATTQAVTDASNSSIELLAQIATNTASCCMSSTMTGGILSGGGGNDTLAGGPIVDTLEETSKESQGIFERMFGGIKSLLGITEDGNKKQSEGFDLLSNSIGSLAGSLLAAAGPKIGKTGGMIGGTLMNAGLASGNMWLAGAGAVASFLGFEKGGVMSSSGPMPLQKYARGGIANTPQLAMFGEGSRPEAYVPLPDGRSIPVTMAGGGGGNVNNISVNVSVAGGQAQTQTSGGGDNTEENSRRLGVAISNAVKQEIFNQQRPGGLLYKGRR